jgi:NTE family protein
MMKVMWFLKKKKKVGLVLGSGGARGLAHIGVIKTLLKNDIPIDMIVGASSGALVGGFYASWRNIERIEEMVREVTYKDLAEVLVDPTWRGALIKGDKTINFLRKNFADQTIENLKIPYASVATDLATAETIVFDKGDLVTAIRASISVPLVYEPLEYKGKTLVDGGVASPVPVEVARKMGAEVVIAVNLDGVYFWDKKNDGRYLGTTVDVIKDSYFALRYNLAKKEVQQAEIVIEPEMKYVQDFDFVTGKEAIAAGELATEKQIGKIKKLI